MKPIVVLIAVILLATITMIRLAEHRAQVGASRTNNNLNGIHAVDEVHSPSPPLPQVPSSSDNPDGNSGSDGALATPTLVRLGYSVYDETVDLTMRESAVTQVEKEMKALTKQYPEGWLRWRPLIIESQRFVSGSIRESKSLPETFEISPFPNLTFLATRTGFRFGRAASIATWEGELDSGHSGTVNIKIFPPDENGHHELRIRMRTPHGHFAIMRSQVPGIYIATESNGAYWENQVVRH